MLEYIWFGALLALSAVLAWVYPSKEAEDVASSEMTAGAWLMGSIGASIMSLVISWNRTGDVALNLLMAALPQGGSPIAILTAYTLLGVGCLLIVVGVPLAVVMLSSYVRERQCK